MGRRYNAHQLEDFKRRALRKIEETIARKPVPEIDPEFIEGYAAIADELGDFPELSEADFGDLAAFGVQDAETLPPAAARWLKEPGSKPRCGRTTQSGALCKAPAVEGKSRCRVHGGNSGPKSLEGRERIADAQRKRWQRFRAAKAGSGPDDTGSAS